MDWERERMRDTLSRLMKQEYVRSADQAFTSGNLTTQRLDVARLPLAESRSLTASDGSPLLIVGLSRIGDGSVIGR
ncbi:MAG: hypothetical protein HRF45_10895 [Fimbriimonadia bacterium]